MEILESKLNLQLFADDKDDNEDEVVEDEGKVGGDDEEEEIEDEKEDKKKDKKGDKAEDEAEEKEKDEEEESDEQEQKKEKVKKDKKDYAIIKAKQEAKKLRDELAKYKQAEAERLEAEKKAKLKQKYIDAGMDEAEAEERANEKARIERLEREIRLMKYENQAEKLSQKYPDIWEHLDRFIDIAEKTGWSLDKICKAELEESSEFDIKTQTEQETILRIKEGKEKKIETGSQKKSESVKLSASDERAYQNYIKWHPNRKNMTRAEYKKLIETETFEE